MTAVEGECVEVEEARAGSRGDMDKVRRVVEEGALEEGGWVVPSRRFGSGGSLGWRFARGELFVQIARSSSSERRVSRRASATSTGEWPANGFPSVAERDGGGVK